MSFLTEVEKIMPSREIPFTFFHDYTPLEVCDLYGHRIPQCVVKFNRKRIICFDNSVVQPVKELYSEGLERNSINFKKKVEEVTKARLTFKQHEAIMALLNCRELFNKGEVDFRSITYAAAKMLKLDRKSYLERLQRGIAELCCKRYAEVQGFFKRRDIRQEDIVRFLAVVKERRGNQLGGQKA